MKPQPVQNTAKCKRCGSQHVTWQHSPRGKWYLTEVFKTEHGELVSDYRDFHSNYCNKPELHTAEQIRRDAEADEDRRERDASIARRERQEAVERETYFVGLMDLSIVERAERIDQIERWLENFRRNPPTMDYMVEFMRETREAEAKRTELEFLKALPVPAIADPAQGAKRPVRKKVRK